MSSFAKMRKQHVQLVLSSEKIDYLNSGDLGSRIEGASGWWLEIKLSMSFPNADKALQQPIFPPRQKPLSSPRVWWLGFPQEPKPFCLRHKCPCSCTLVIKHKQMQQSAASPKKRRKVEKFLTRSVRWLSFAKGLGKTSRTAKQCSYVPHNTPCFK